LTSNLKEDSATSNAHIVT